MNEYNKSNKYYCHYCNKECKSKNSLIQHEIRCKNNPNQINMDYLKNNKWDKTVGYKWMNNGDKNIFIHPSKIKFYLDSGWKFGVKNETKERISKSLIGKSSGKCKDPILEEYRKQKISKSLKGNTNWKYNKTRGNGKQGYYKNIHCDSTWELAFLVYYLDHNMYIKRCTESRDYIFEEEIHKYYPDFITDEGIIEVKGRLDKKAIEKQKQNPDIIIYDKIKMKSILEYIIDKYGNDFWKKLYEK